MIKHNLKRPHKYGVKSTKQARTVDGIAFDSLKEALYYGELRLRVRAGEVVTFLRQVPFPLPPTFPMTKYVCDFLEFWQDNSIHVIDVKGYRTAAYKMKKKAVEQYYPFKIEEK